MYDKFQNISQIYEFLETILQSHYLLNKMFHKHKYINEFGVDSKHWREQQGSLDLTISNNPKLEFFIYSNKKLEKSD